jgi:hypothetical protein
MSAAESGQMPGDRTSIEKVSVSQGFVGQTPLLQRLLLLLLFIVAMAALLQQVTVQSQRSWDSPQLAVTLGDAHYRLKESQLLWLQDFSALYFNEQSEQARVMLETEISRQLTDVFAIAAGRLPEFADWYYSLSGEYGRILMALLTRLRLSDASYVAEHAASILFPAGIWDDQMLQAQQQLADIVLSNQQQVRAAWLSEISARLSRYQVPAPLNIDKGREPEEVLALDKFLEHMQTQESALDVRMSLSTVAAMGVAGQTLWRAASSRSAALAGRATAGRVGARGAGRVGSAALSGGAVCTPAGALALGCAVAAGAAAWVASDWLLLQLDEAWNREELLVAMQAGLDELQLLTEQGLLNSYDGLVAAWYDSIATEINTDFVPAQVFQR